MHGELYGIFFYCRLNRQCCDKRETNLKLKQCQTVSLVLSLSPRRYLLPNVFSYASALLFNLDIPNKTLDKPHFISSYSPNSLSFLRKKENVL